MDSSTSHLTIFMNQLNGRRGPVLTLGTLFVVTYLVDFPRADPADELSMADKEIALVLEASSTAANGII